MADPRFFKRAAPLTLGQLAGIAGATLAAGADPERRIADVAALDAAGPDDISFLDNRKYRSAFEASRAGACITRPEHATAAPEGMALLLTAQPYLGFARIAQAFYPRPAAQPGIAPRATVHPAAEIGDGVEIATGAVVEEGAVIGARCRIGPNAVIGAGVVLGDDCEVGACASLSHCLVGRRVIIYPGARIGADGFGFAMQRDRHVRLPQLGRVIIGDDVEVGANTCIDRGAGPDTVIGAGCMIDNLVQIGHNVEIGPGSVIVAQTGISGSVKLGDHVLLAGQTGIAGHLKIGAGAKVGAKSGVTRDIPPGESVFGIPAVPIRQFFRRMVLLNRLADSEDQ